MTKKLLTILILFNTTFCFSQNWERIDSIFAPSGVTVSSFTAPVFGDLDGDNDLDLILGSFDDKIHFFENIGSAVNPKFKEDTSVISPIYANGFQFTNSYYPALVDLDNDSDFDLVIGGYNKLLYYANIGNQLNPIFQKGDTTIFSNVNIDIGTDARQAFADLDNDGDMDLIVGIGESLFGGPTAGISMGFRNIGTTTSPMFQRDDALVSGIPDVGLNAYPALADLDNDGDYDLLIGRDGLTFYYYKNNGNSSAPVWSREFTTFANIESTNYWKDPTFADLDGDSDFDLIYGTDDGKINFYEDTGSAASPQFQFNPEYFVIHKVDGSSTVSFADFDSDGDLDLLSGSLFNNLQYFQNMGTSAQPKFEKKSTIFTSLSIG
ncbi:MAG: VCBS repeat-containing protein, partial [Ignavibacteriaceae bacterium]